MLDFTPVSLADSDAIRAAAHAAGTLISEYTFCILFAWQEAFSPRITFRDGMLLSTVETKSGIRYPFPIGGGDTAAALDTLRRDAEERGIPLRLCYVPEQALPLVREYFGGRAAFDFDPGFSDYVYSAEALATLSGRKYHSKKNHVNRFMAENDWRFEPITAENIGLCRTLAAAWAENAPEERRAAFAGEISALNKTLDNYFEMGMDGGVLITQDGPVAFTVGEMLRADTFCTQFEKAFSHVNGAYAAVNQQFAKYILEKYPQVRYINREEDVGLPTLRKAKESYHPEFLVRKYTAVQV